MAIYFAIGANMQNQTGESATLFDTLSVVVAFLSFVVSMLALLVARRSAKDSKRSADASERSALAAEKSAAISEQAVGTNVAMFKRQGVIDLHLAWSDIGQIKTDESEMVTEDLRRAVNALELTASLWNHDVIEKEILYRSYWPAYKSLYANRQCFKNSFSGMMAPSRPPSSFLQGLFMRRNSSPCARCQILLRGEPPFPHRDRTFVTPLIPSQQPCDL